MKESLGGWNSLDEDEKAGAMFCAGLVGIALFVAFFLIWAVVTDEYSIKTTTECEIFEHTLNNGKSRSTCVKRTTTYTCKMDNGPTFAVCEESKRCEDVCNKLRGE